MRQRLTTADLEALLAEARPRPAGADADTADLDVLRRITATPRPVAPRRRRVTWPSRKGSRLAATVIALVLPAGAIAVAAGTLLQPPKVDHRIPSPVGWRYVETPDGPTLQRLSPAWIRAENEATEAALRAKGYDRPRCGIDPAHPAACFNPDGTPIGDALAVVVADATANRYLSGQGSPESMEIRRLTPAQAAAWLAAHPGQRPR